MAMGVLDVARRWGVAVPDQLSVVGFDDIRFAGYMSPPLTTIAQPMREIGEGVVRLLLGILSGEGNARVPQSVTLPHELIVRATTAKRT
jgi:LacI family repressor for deo operon, udp, cdd, tsx, nupC, and nupG